MTRYTYTLHLAWAIIHPDRRRHSAYQHPKIHFIEARRLTFVPIGWVLYRLAETNRSAKLNKRLLIAAQTTMAGAVLAEARFTLHNKSNASEQSRPGYEVTADSALSAVVGVWGQLSASDLDPSTCSARLAQWFFSPLHGGSVHKIIAYFHSPKIANTPLPD